MAKSAGEQFNLVERYVCKRLSLNTWTPNTYRTSAGQRHVSDREITSGCDPQADRRCRVKTRLERGDGMSYAEFSYPLVQAWDWWHLFQKGVQIQVGGGDQFGNILAGAEAVKQLAKDSHEYQTALRQTTIIDKKYYIDVTSDPLGITVPLLTTASGEKFGKSAGNAVWLEPRMTPIFDLYQVSLFPFPTK